MSWVDHRTPPVPDAFRPHLTREAGEDDSVEGLTATAMVELEKSLARPGRDRQAAFHLLAADAYTSYACELAADADDVESSLLGILAAVQVTED